MADNLNKLTTLGVIKKIVERIKQAFPTDLGDLTNTPGYQTSQQVEAAITAKGYQTAFQVEQSINAKVSSVYKAGGSVTAATLPTPSADNLGMVYNVSDAFTTTASFLEGSGKKHPAGTNIVVVQDGGSYKFDVLAGFVDTSGLASKASSAVNGHLAALDASGNLKDSGKSATDFVSSVTAGTESGKIKVDGVDVTVCEIASDSEASAMLDEVFK